MDSVWYYSYDINTSAKNFVPWKFPTGQAQAFGHLVSGNQGVQYGLSSTCEEGSVVVKEKQFVVFDLDKQVVLSAHDDEGDARQACRSEAGRKESRVTVLKPLMVSEPKKETVEREL